MDTKVIEARRERIQETAPCEGCGASLASCKAHRGKDKTAPPWFGCCARGTAFGPCNHVPSVRELTKLLKEIESGHVKPPPTEDEELLASVEEFPLMSASPRGRSLRARVMAMVPEDGWKDL